MESPVSALPPIPSHGPGDGGTPPEGSEAVAVLGLPALGNWQQKSGEIPEPGGPQIVEVSEPWRSLSCGGHQIVEAPEPQRSPNCGGP